MAKSRLTTAQRRKLLNVVADFIEPLPRKKLDMDVFGVETDFVDPSGGRLVSVGPTMHDCGTAGCALGWAVSIPAVAAAGLAPKNLLGVGDPWKIAAKTFGIDEHLSIVLFGHGRRGHRTPAQVAKNLRYAAKTGKPAPALRAAYAKEKRDAEDDRAND